MASLAAFFAGAAACGPPPDVEPLACRNKDPGLAEVGGGTVTQGFRALTVGAPLAVIFGAQGQHMILASVRVEALELPAGGGGTSIEVGLSQGGEMLAGTVVESQPTVTRPGVVEFLGLRALFTVDEITPYIGELAELKAVVTDGCGRSLEDARRVTLIE